MRKAALATLSALALSASGDPAAGAPVPTLHLSDLFRPHDDPDDHWDLAAQYALANQGRIDLLGVMIDFPKPERRNAPDLIAVAQMNLITGRAVPVVIGTPSAPPAKALLERTSAQELAGVRALLDWMRRSPEPVTIHVLGSCRDAAIATRMDPGLFGKKCRAIYLNAGSGTADPELARRLEWNVTLDPGSYADLFEAPCPIYWLPCFEVVQERPADLFRVAEHGSFYRFKQGDILPHVSARVQNFFASMFAAGRFAETTASRPVGADQAWPAQLLGATNGPFLDALAKMQRNMWCTAGFLHAAGITVTKAGRLVPLAQAGDAVFTFEPVKVACTPEGVTRWTRSPESRDRFLFRVTDVAAYPGAMTAALRSLLETLP